MTCGVLPGRTNLQARTSEEKYVPMPLTMKRALVEGRRFRHVQPPGEHVGESARGGVEKSDVSSSEVQVELLPYGLTRSEDGVVSVMTTSESDSSVEVSRVEPVVTVFSQQNDSPVMTKSKSSCKDNNTPANTKHLQLSPQLTNRRYSLIDLKTGLKKSKFTLELEDKLRQSKFNLGFDDDLNDWKEFSYRMENPESGKRVESLKKGQLRFGLESNVGKGLEKVCLRDPLQYCEHNCQILGLCSVRSPDILPKKETCDPSLLKDEIDRTYNEVQSILKGEMEHHKREDCNCDHCVLAYLTEMGFPEGDCNNRCVSARKGRSPKGSPSSCRKRIKERIRIVEKENTRASIEISVSTRPSDSVIKVGENSSQSNMSAGTLFEDDMTNRRIKRMFQKNNAAVQGSYGLRKEGQDVTSMVNLASVEDIFKTSGCFDNRSEEVLQFQTREIRRASLGRRRRRGSNGKRSSSSTLGASVSSSLSSVLSYKRVRQIFQSIIERNRVRRRPRNNVNKFRELEELGLGEVKNNRWYPSDSKTVSIWHGMHQSVQGIQAEFKKYPKTYLKRLD